MNSLPRRLLTMGVGTIVLLIPEMAFAASTATSEPGANEVQAQMPIPGGAGRVRGCWRSDHAIYGQYRIRFCLDRNGKGDYRVNGARLTCRGTLGWSQTKGAVRLRMDRGRCNGNTDWSRDRLSCDYNSRRDRMNCTYTASHGPWHPTRFTANRIGN